MIPSLRLIPLLLCLCLAPLALRGADPLRPVTASYMAGFGSAHVTDAYLAPFPTAGWATALVYERAQALRSRPRQWTGTLSASLDLSRGYTRGTLNGTMWGAALTLRAAAMRRLPSPVPRLGLAVGPQIELLAGAHYRPSNGNNPVSARLALTAGLAARAGYSLRLGRLPVDLSLTPSVQLLGTFLAPAYGQLYYEIYEGDTRGIVRLAWPGNRLSYHHLLAADLRLGATSLRLGYSLTLLTREASHLAVNTATHLFMVGITTDFITLRRHSGAPRGSEPVIYPF